MSLETARTSRPQPELSVEAHRALIKFAFIAHTDVTEINGGMPPEASRDETLDIWKVAID